jgi:zinc protease
MIDRTRPPAPGAIRGFDFPDVTASALDSGLALRLARLPRLPIVTAALTLDAGEAAVDETKAGLAVLTGDALEGGTEERSGADFAEALEGIGASFRVSTGWDGSTLAISCLADRLDEAAALLAEAVRRPAFPEEEVARYRSQRLAAIAQRAMDPGALATDTVQRHVFAEGVPYGRPLAGTTASVEQLGPADAAAFAAERYQPRDGGFVVAGDLDEGQVKALADRHFGDWSGKGAARPAFTPRPRHLERRVVVVHRPGAVQSEIRMAHVGVPRATPDFFPLKVFNMILGGAFTSRLNLNLREKNGFTYGVRSSFGFRREAGPFTISTAVGTDVTAAAVREALSETERLLSEGPTEEEVAASRDYIAGIFPLQLETTGQVASRIAELVLFGLPDDYYATYRDNIRAVEVAAVAEAGRRHVRPAEMTVLVVGDAEAVRGPLEALDLGPLEVVDP